MRGNYIALRHGPIHCTQMHIIARLLWIVERVGKEVFGITRFGMIVESYQHNTRPINHVHS